MAVIWPTYINEVKDICLNQMRLAQFNNGDTELDADDAARLLGLKMCDAYMRAIKMAMSPYGELWGGSGDDGALTSSYQEAHVLLVNEGREEVGKIEDDLDENGNKIDGTGKESDPEFNDPDTEIPEVPPVDPEKLREFVKEYKDEYDLHEFIYFEFHVEEKEKETVVTENPDGTVESEIVYGDVIYEGINETTTSSKLSDIIATRILVQFESLSKSKRKKLVDWIETFEKEPGITGYSQQTSYFNKVESAITKAGHTARHSNGRLSLVMSVYDKVIGALESSYGNGVLTDLIDDNNDVQPIIYPFNGRELHIHIAQQPSDKPDNPEIPEILDPYFITYFSFDGSTKEAWDFKSSEIQSDYLHDSNENISELKKHWFKCPSNLEGATQEDIASAIGGTLYMLTRQELLDALEEQEEDEDAKDPYEMMSQATIDYWKSAAAQPLKKMPAAPPAIISSPLGGKYVGVYYGNMKMLAEDLRKAFNSGKAFKKTSQKTLAVNTVATNLSVAYAKHLLQLKFIYLGGIPTPGGPVPMVGFVPFVS